MNVRGFNVSVSVVDAYMAFQSSAFSQEEDEPEMPLHERGRLEVILRSLVGKVHLHVQIVNTDQPTGGKWPKDLKSVQLKSAAFDPLDAQDRALAITGVFSQVGNMMGRRAVLEYDFDGVLSPAGK